MSARQSQFGWRLLIGSLLPVIAGLLPANLIAAPPDTAPSVPPVAPARPIDSVVSPDLIGRTVEEVRVVGNGQVSSQVILNQVKTHKGDLFNPEAVQEDYQKIYTLKQFSNVEAKIEPTRTGVIIIFEVSEEKLIRSIRFVGNYTLDSDELEKLTDLKVGEAIEQFRIALAQRSIVAGLRGKNHPFAHVEVNMADLTRTGELVFHVTEGAPLAIQKIDFIGNKSFTANELDLFGKLNDQIKTRRSLFILDSGNYDPEQVDEDVASLRHFYQSQGFFDARIGRKVIISPDQTEAEVDFVIEEGVRYKVAHVSFVGNRSVTDATLRKNMSLLEGRTFDSESVQHDVKEIIKAYSPLGFVVDSQSNDPAYLHVGKPEYPFQIKTVYHKQPGTVDLVYEIAEGRPFRLGNLLVKGNQATQQKVVLREFGVQPGQLYDSGKLEEGLERVKSLPEFASATLTPIGNSPDTRDVLIEVKEQSTADISFGGQFDSNNGLGGRINYQQKNFDALNFPSRIDDLLDRKAFVGAGQSFNATFQPGVDVTNATVSFTEPYVLDQPFSNTDQAYYSEYSREAWNETKAGGAITFGKQIDYNWSTSISFQAEDVKVGDIVDYFPVYQKVDVISQVTREPVVDPANGRVRTQLRSVRAPEILERNGHNTVTNIGWAIVRDTTNRGPLTYTGNKAAFDYSIYGGLGGQYTFNKFTFGFDNYTTLNTDLLDRKTVLDLHVDSGYITADAPFFERFYDGGRGSLRGFEYRGVSPRGGRASDPIGGDFELNGTVELSFPVYGDNFRGVVFTDVGTVEPDIRIHTIRQSVGTGIRVVIPFLSRAPLAFDIAIPVTKSSQDTKQIFSFGIGIR